MNDELWDEVFEIASVAARRCHRRFGRWAEFDDLRSAALEYAVRRNELVEDFLNREDPAERRRGIGGLTKTLERAAERYARKEKARALGYRTEDEYFYTEPIVESLVLAWSRGDTDSAGQVFDPAEMGRRGRKPASEGGDLLAMLADVGAAMKKLDARTHGIVFARAAQNRTVEEIAEAWDISHQRVTQIYKRGVLDLIDHLGGVRP